MQETTGESQTNQPGAKHAGCFVCNTAIPMLESLWPASINSHFRNSRIEFLKGIRSLLDDRIARLSQDERKGSRVTVE